MTIASFQGRSTYTGTSRLSNVTLAVLLSLLGWAPVITSMLSWDLDGQLSPLQYQIRHYAYPTIAVEYALILYAFSTGLRPAMLIETFRRWQALMLVAILLAAVLAAGQLSLEPAREWLATFTWLIHFLFFGAALFVARNSSEHLVWFWRMLVLGTFGYALTIIFFAVYVPDTENFPWITRPPGVTNVRHIGYFVAPAMAILIAWHLGGQHVRVRLGSVFGLALLTAFGFWTGTRGIFVALIASCAVALFAYPGLRKWRIWSAVVISIGIGAATSAPIPVPAYGFGILARASPEEFSTIKRMGSGRIELWEDTVRAIARAPLIGYGAGKFRAVMSTPDRERNHPHNLVLQIFFQWGALGAIGFFSLLLSAWIRSFANARQSGLSTAPAFLVLNTMLAYSLIDGTGYYPLPLSIMGLAFAHLLSRKDACASGPTPASSTIADIRAWNILSATASIPPKP